MREQADLIAGEGLGFVSYGWWVVRLGCFVLIEGGLFRVSGKVMGNQREHSSWNDCHPDVPMVIAMSPAGDIASKTCYFARG